MDTSKDDVAYVPATSHMWITRNGAPPADSWTCNYCSISGTYMHLVENVCTHNHEPCVGCSVFPECSPDCELVNAALANAVSNGYHVVPSVEQP